MPEIRAVVVDDEPLARRGIVQLASAHDDLSVVGEAGDGVEALQLIRRTRPDLLFLDVEMPELGGFGVLLHEVEPEPVVVFVTAYEDFAFKAFQVDAADYLLKPVAAPRFAECMERVRARLGPVSERTRVVVREGGRDLVLGPDDIDWVEAHDYYAAVHAGGRSFLVRESLASLGGRLPAARFLRVHRSALVNLDRVRSLVTGEGAGGALVLRTGETVPVSRRARGSVQAWLREQGRR